MRAALREPHAVMMLAQALRANSPSNGDVGGQADR
jgi:hypothetical protein